jgi:hypothetical protein
MTNNYGIAYTKIGNEHCYQFAISGTEAKGSPPDCPWQGKSGEMTFHPIPKERLLAYPHCDHSALHAAIRSRVGLASMYRRHFL